MVEPTSLAPFLQGRALNATRDRALRLPQLFSATACFAVTFLAFGSAQAAGVERLPLLNSDFPIVSAVTVHAGTDIVFLSGALSGVNNPAAPKNTLAAYGDTEAQTTGALTAIKGTLARLGLGMGDVIKMTVFIAADPATGKMDFAGMMKGYIRFFGKDQPNKPARSAFQVAALAAPWALVEIEVVAAKSH
jgi:enamine deaminase RidA (YjgF/YER057c/UK114 family)